jgi:hypothetical protein
MPKRPRSTHSPRNHPDPFVPKPPPRKSFEKPIGDSAPLVQRLLSRPMPQLEDKGCALKSTESPYTGAPPSSRRPDYRTPNTLPKRPEIPSLPPPGRPTRSETGSLRERLEADVRRMKEDRKVQEPEQSSANELIVPMVCAPTQQAFVVRFTRTFPIDRWHGAETFLVSGGGAAAAPTAMKVPLREMNWAGISCPGCGQCCAPVLCECGRLGCDGGVTGVAGSRRMYRCSCGATGFLEPGLKEVSGAKAGKAQAPQNATSTASTSLVRRLPGPE